jgi:hypothetical protein
MDRTTDVRRRDRQARDRGRCARPETPRAGSLQPRHEVRSAGPPLRRPVHDPLSLPLWDNGAPVQPPRRLPRRQGDSLRTVHSRGHSSGGGPPTCSSGGARGRRNQHSQCEDLKPHSLPPCSPGGGRLCERLLRVGLRRRPWRALNGSSQWRSSAAPEANRAPRVSAGQD